jgi:hypothetical protein
MLWLICIVVGALAHKSAVFWLMTATAATATVCLVLARHRIQTWVTWLIASVTVSLELTDALIHGIPLWIVAGIGTIGAIVFAGYVKELSRAAREAGKRTRPRLRAATIGMAQS